MRVKVEGSVWSAPTPYAERWRVRDGLHPCVEEARVQGFGFMVDNGSMGGVPGRAGEQREEVNTLE